MSDQMPTTTHDAIQEISAALTSFIDRQHGLYLPWNLALLAEVYILAGDSAGALTAVEDGLLVVSRHDQRLYLSELLRLKGELAMLHSDYEEANSCFREALEVARSQDAKLLELRAALSLARYDEKQGQLIEAFRVLKPIYDWFTEGLETPDLQEARAMLEVLPHC
ncbi:hypothetical protein ILT44_27965 [Microvirga sp. BT689]|uniref:hypothetical protein n=1 Tax=Microvirga arvi TaxID=2778731 RepID=UPI0019508908|nr:hypothetical protein [Microvirga arvi]MBM6584041.1 hypothetical protein [Microvirga arvi]